MRERQRDRERERQRQTDRQIDRGREDGKFDEETPRGNEMPIKTEEQGLHSG